MSTLPIPQLNSIKKKMSVAYLHGINATINYTLQESNPEWDNLGIDLSISSFLVGQKRSVASDANQIYVQLKGVAASSHSMFTEDESSITYTLSDDLHQVGTMYLIIVVLPSDEQVDTWREVDETKLLLKARAYYLRVDGVLRRGRINIPKANLLTPDNYMRLFERASEDVT